VVIIKRARIAVNLGLWHELRCHSSTRLLYIDPPPPWSYTTSSYSHLRLWRSNED